jgi:hypothetical protein
MNVSKHYRRDSVVTISCPTHGILVILRPNEKPDMVGSVFMLGDNEMFCGICLINAFNELIQEPTIEMRKFNK